MLRTVAWTLLNFCRGNPEPPFDKIRPALPALMCLMYSDYKEVLTDACWAISYLSDGSYDKIQAVIEAGVCQRLYELLRFYSSLVLEPVLGIIRNIAKGGDVQIQCIIEHCLLHCMVSFLTIPDSAMDVKEVCRTISYITAGNKEQIQAVIEADLFDALLNLSENAEFDVKKEAACAISNATCRGSSFQISYLVDQNCIKPLCDLLDCPESRIVIVCLEGLANILMVGEDDNNILGTKVCYNAQLIDEAKGLEKIKKLQSHDNNEIREKAVEIVKTYYLPYRNGAQTDGSCMFGNLKLVKVGDEVMIVQ
ncbi:importin subunit alpha-1a-like [Apium graveolens]|uniref:IBB domain-containing protein n=1 Tax=Apium graveolens TaxID=4045 RepID=A0A6L5B9L0_APIGR|nr:hypothetical protein AG4045_028448 [Apium graveolens]